MHGMKTMQFNEATTVKCSHATVVCNRIQ